MTRRLPTNRRVAAETLYPILTCIYALALSTVISVSLVYQTIEAGLNPFQLVMVGTVLEATTFLFEVPTGIVADARSRRLSVIIGMCLMGVGFIFSGAWASFWPILAAHVILGIGETFISGALQGWIADEVGVERVGQLYLKGQQTDQYGRLLGIPAGVGLGVLSLRFGLFAGGGLLLLLAVLLAFAMTERGFTAPPKQGRSNLRILSDGFRAAATEVNSRPLLLTLFGMMAFYGAASEGFGRLWIAHFNANIGFPSFVNLEPVVWFGILRAGSTLLALTGLQYIRKRITDLDHHSVSRGLMIVNALQFTSLAGLAFAGNFYLAAVMYWSAITLSRIWDPLYLTWLNQNVDSAVRATVISMSSQMDSLGQIGGGPILGAIGNLRSLRLAILGAAVALLPAIALNFRAFGQGHSEVARTVDAPQP